MSYLQLPHKVADHACPINGLEDLYEWKTGHRLPGYFLMDLSMIGFLYIKQKNAPTPRMVFWGNGTGRPQHQLLSDVIGYKWTISEDKSFSTAWKLARQSIDRGLPVIMGLVDMFHLPYYPRFYHKIHIPQHYVLLVGYDQEKGLVYVQDNGLPGVQSVPFPDLEQAWNVNNPGQGKKNTLVIVEFEDHIAPMEMIVEKGLKKKAHLVLNPPVGFMGIKGMRKLAAEMPHWTDELSPDAIQKCLNDLVMFTCSVVPMPPQRLLPFKLSHPDSHQAVRDRFSRELAGYADTMHRPEWKEAADLFAESGKRIGRLTDLITDRILAGKTDLAEPARIIHEIANFEEQAYHRLAG